MKYFYIVPFHTTKKEYCDICNDPMVIELHCKLKCTNCGYTRDCS